MKLMPAPQMQAMLLAAAMSALIAGPALSAQGADPTWPCIQRKVPSLSLGQVWTGAELPPSAAGWSKDSAVSALVRDISARRMPIAEAEAAIQGFAKAQASDQRGARMAMLAQGLFDHMNAERADVIAGIARYAQNQLAMAARLRAEGSKFAELRADPNASADAITARTEQMALETRIFEERVQSLTYVCEVPTFIEQRLYALSKAIAKTMAGP
jgi:hypothetical protein